MNYKICSKCKELKPLDAFEKSNSCKDGHRGTCKQCRQEQKNKKHQLQCEVCGEKFTSSRKEAKYCSEKCQHLARRNRVKVKCSYCGKELEVIKSKADSQEYFYCNQQCRTEHLKTIMKGTNNPNFNKVKYNCDGCNKEIYIKPYKIKSQKHIFCSEECYTKNIGKFYKGENNSNWNKNLTSEERELKRRYPKYYEWRNKVYERDNYTCQICGSSKSGTLIAHHLNGYNWDIEHRTDIDNGITLCTRCHNEFHNKFGCGNNTKEQFEQFLNIKLQVSL